MDQPKLWYESLEDAIGEVVSVSGGPKRLASQLWPDKPVADAARQLRHCLDPVRPEKLEMSQIVFVMRVGRQAGCHAPMAYLSQELSYEDPRPVEPESETQRLQREFINAQKQLQQILQRFEKVSTPASMPLRAVG